MKTSLALLLLFCAILCGCATLTDQIVNGRDFDESKVTQLKKMLPKPIKWSDSTASPIGREIVSGTDVMWHYSYLNQVTKTHSGFYASVVVNVDGYRKNLDILLQNDVVINYAYVKVPMPPRCPARPALQSCFVPGWQPFYSPSGEPVSPFS